MNPVDQDKIIQNRNKVAAKMEEALFTARDVGVTPHEFCDLMLTLSALVCRITGITKKEFADAAIQHYEDAAAENPPPFSH